MYAFTPWLPSRPSGAALSANGLRHKEEEGQPFRAQVSFSARETYHMGRDWLQIAEGQQRMNIVEDTGSWDTFRKRRHANQRKAESNPRTGKSYMPERISRSRRKDPKTWTSSSKYSIHVGVTRLELAALWSQTRCATKLRYTPTKMAGAVGFEPTARGFGDRCSTN